MQYAITVIVEADSLKAAILKVPDDLGEVASANPRPQPNPQGMAGLRPVLAQPSKS